MGYCKSQTKQTYHMYKYIDGRRMKLCDDGVNLWVKSLWPFNSVISFKTLKELTFRDMELLLGHRFPKKWMRSVKSFVLMTSSSRHTNGVVAKYCLILHHPKKIHFKTLQADSWVLF